MDGPKVVKIGTRQFELLPLAPEEGAVLLFRIARTLGPALAKSASAAQAGASNIDTIADAIATLSADSGADDLFSDLLKAFKPKTSMIHADGSGASPLPSVFDVVFAANYLDLMLWFRECVELNFGPFFRGVLAGPTSAGSTTNV